MIIKYLLYYIYIVDGPGHSTNIHTHPSYPCNICIKQALQIALINGLESYSIVILASVEYLWGNINNILVIQASYIWNYVNKMYKLFREQNIFNVKLNFSYNFVIWEYICITMCCVCVLKDNRFLGKHMLTKVLTDDTWSYVFCTHHQILNVMFVHKYFKTWLQNGDHYIYCFGLN